MVGRWTDDVFNIKKIIGHKTKGANPNIGNYKKKISF